MLPSVEDHASEPSPIDRPNFVRAKADILPSVKRHSLLYLCILGWNIHILFVAPLESDSSCYFS